jgi:hypothetical protein
MKNLTRYENFVVESVEVRPLNEGMFDKLKSVFSRITQMFNDPKLLNKQMDQASAKAGTSDDNVSAKAVKNGYTVLVRLVSPTDENVKSLISFTKLGDLPDGSGLFQITGSDNEGFLSSLGVSSVSNLVIVGVIAIVDPVGFKKDTSLTMRVYKNVSKEGKPFVTDGAVKATVAAEIVAKEKPE